MSLTVVLADPHPIFLLGIQHLFSSEPDLQVVARCNTAGDTLKAVRSHRPDLLVLDVHFPDRSGLQIIRELKGDSLPTRSILLQP